MAVILLACIGAVAVLVLFGGGAFWPRRPMLRYRSDDEQSVVQPGERPLTLTAVAFVGGSLGVVGLLVTALLSIGVLDRALTGWRALDWPLAVSVKAEFPLVVSFTLVLAMQVALTYGSVGAFRLRSWSRSLLIAWAAAVLVAALLVIGLAAADWHEPAAQVFLLVWMSPFLLVVLPMELLLAPASLYVLTRRHVRAAFG